MQVIKENGKVVEVDCDNFADESFPLSEIRIKCYDERGYPKCPVWEECFKIYTRRANE